MIRPSSAALLALSAACGPLALESPIPEVAFESEWAERPDRTWIGARYWANRLQDWRLRGDEAQCVEGRLQSGVRTLHVLTHHLRGGPDREGSFRAAVTIDAPAGDRAGSAAGLLVGAGGPHVDYRLSAHVAGAPAEDGGLLAIVDGDGRARLLDFEAPLDGGAGGWTIRPTRDLDALRALAADDAGPGFGGAGPRPVRLTLVGACYDGRRTLTLTVADAASGDVLSTAQLEDAPESAFDGNVALVSHRGPTPAEGATGKPPGYAFRSLSLAGDLVARDDERAFGPILFVHYTVHRAEQGPRLGLTAQAAPLGPDDGRVATLHLADADGEMLEVATAQFVEDSATFHFDVGPGFDPGADTAFEVRYVPADEDGEPDPGRTQVYPGVIAAEPGDGDVTIGLLSCQKSFTGGLRWNESGLWFPHADVARSVAAHEPDLLYFAGDQIYEGDITGAVRAPLEDALLDYLGKWYRHGWSFGELTRRLPAVVVPDDHDVYHGNIWGNGGVRGEAPEGVQLSAQDRGGYVMDPLFVNAVHRTQVAHLPHPEDADPLPGGITVYHSILRWGGGSFAILSDRMFKSAPAVALPEAEVRNGWPQKEGWGPATEADVEGVELLGPRQEAMLERWAAERAPDVWFRACLSQTPFVNVATIPMEASSGGVIPSLEVPDVGAYVVGDKRVADFDSGAWPQSKRDRAVALLRDAGAFHLAGDQHLGSTVRYGVDAFDDAGYAFAGPAVANTWPRRWFPPPSDRQGEPLSDDAPPYTGRFFDGFGNRMTVLAVANPRRTEIEPTRLNDRGPGYGVVHVRRTAGGGADVTFEAWPRLVDPTAPGARPYGGWPVSFTLPPLR